MSAEPGNQAEKRAVSQIKPLRPTWTTRMCFSLRCGIREKPRKSSLLRLCQPLHGGFVCQRTSCYLLKYQASLKNPVELGPGIYPQGSSQPPTRPWLPRPQGSRPCPRTLGPIRLRGPVGSLGSRGHAAGVAVSAWKGEVAASFDGSYLLRTDRQDLSAEEGWRNMPLSPAS